MDFISGIFQDRSFANELNMGKFYGWGENINKQSICIQASERRPFFDVNNLLNLFIMFFW